MKKLFYPLTFALSAFLFVNSCSTDEDDAPPPALFETIPPKVIEEE